MTRRRSPALALLVSFATVATTVSACGAGSKVAGGQVSCDVDAPANPVSVQVLAYSAPSIDPFSNAMAKGCSKVKNLTVEHGQIDFGAQLEKAQLSLSQNGKGSYNIVEVYGGTLPQYAAKGWLQPLDAFVKSSGSRYDINGIDPRLRQAFTYDGKLYGLPMEVNVHVMVYRKDILNSLGITPPTTFDQLVAAAVKIKAAHKAANPISISYGASSDIGAAFNNSLTSLGGKWVDPKTNTPQLTSAKAIAAIASLRRLLPYMSSNALAFSGPQVQSALQNGQSAIGILYSGQAAQVTAPGQSKYTKDFGYAMVPSVVSGGGPWATLNVDGFAVAKNSAASLTLVSQIAAVGTGEAAARQAGTAVYPARTNVVKDPSLVAKAPEWKIIESTLAANVPTYPKVGYFVPMQTAVDPFLAAAVSGKTPVKQAMRQAQSAAEKVISTYTAASGS